MTATLSHQHLRQPARSRGRSSTSALAPAEAAASARPQRRPDCTEALQARLPADVYRRRRLGLLAAFLVVVATIVFVAAHVAGAGAALEGPPPAPVVYVVQPGDSLWSIAKAVAPGDDTREVVGRLSKVAGGAALHPGQRLELPRDLGR